MTFYDDIPQPDWSRCIFHDTPLSGGCRVCASEHAAMRAEYDLANIRARQGSMPMLNDEKLPYMTVRGLSDDRCYPEERR